MCRCSSEVMLGVFLSCSPLFLKTKAVLKLKPSNGLEQWARPSGSPSPPPVQRLQRVLPCPALSGCWAFKTRSSCLGIKTLFKETSRLALYLECHVCDHSFVLWDFKLELLSLHYIHDYIECYHFISLLCMTQQQTHRNPTGLTKK